MSRIFSNKKKGFTVVELLTSLAIMGVVLTVILFSQASYTDAAGISALAEEVSIRINESQAYGVAVKERLPGTSDFAGAYGVSLTLIPAGGELVYIVFADTNSNGVYDGTIACETGVGAECVEKVTIARGNYIYSICAVRSTGGDQCSSPRRADISFLRPNLAARISLFTQGGSAYSPANMTGVRLVFKSPKGLTRSVVVYYSGQISVQSQ